MFQFAVIGVGNIGFRHAQLIQANPSAQLSAICDVNPARLNEAHVVLNQNSLVTTTDFEEVLQIPEVQIIHICTPNNLHAPMTIAALNAGKHVVCEKPMALSTRDCDAMIAAALNNNKYLFVVKQNRYNPPVVAVKQLLLKQGLGQIHQVVVNCFWNRNDAYYQKPSWRGTKKQDGGCLFTQFSHFIDILYYLTGDADCLSGYVQNATHQHSIEFEDSGAFLLKSHEQQAVITVNFNICAFGQNMEGSITLLGSEGAVKIGGQYLNTLDYWLVNNYPKPELQTIVQQQANDYGSYKGSMSNHDKVIENVIDTLLGRATIATNGTEGRKIIELIEKMYRSVAR